jgi:phosphate transport system protein
MERHFDQELSDLQQMLLTMASHAETMVNEAVEALITRDDALAKAAHDHDKILDRLEMEVDELAIHLLTKAPLATDLRLITVVMKICQNLERGGDEATKISKRVHDLNSEPPLKITLDIRGITRAALEMLKSALDAFVRRDSAAARSVIEQDKEVNGMNRDIHRILLESMMAERENIARCLNLMVVSKSLERIGDHATNIAEEVVFLCDSMDIRHPKHVAAKAI